MTQLYCQKCKKMLNDTNFYQYRDGTKCELCKQCLTMHIDNYDKDTFLWILEKFDVPYVEAEWNILRDKAYAKNPLKMTGMSVIGKYLSKMKLKQWKDARWADTARYAAAAEKNQNEHRDVALEAKIENMQKAYEAGEITESQLKTYTETVEPEPQPNIPPPIPVPYVPEIPQLQPQVMIQPLVDFAADLTEEDKKYLALEWGVNCTPNDWVALEKLKEDFTKSFDIEDAGRRVTLKNICKTSLNMDKAIDTGDIETYQKLAKVFDSLMKSGKFTQAQNKTDAHDELGSIGEIVAFAEKEGGRIPRYDISVSRDVVDTVIKDMKEYTRDLIYEDKALAPQIEAYLKKREQIDEKKRRGEIEENETVTLTNQDYMEMYDQIEQEREQDLATESEED